MKINKFFLPNTAESYIRAEFSDRAVISQHNETTIIIEFQDSLDGQDLINLFFCGAKWAINLKTT